VLGTIGVPIIMIAISVTRSAEEGNLFGKILERNRTAMHRIAGDFRRCLSGTCTVTNSGKTLSFTLPSGFDGTGPISGDAVQFEIRPDPSDPANLADDNRNGVIDESVLVRVNSTSGEEVTIAPYLDTSSSGFAITGDGVTVTLTTIGWTAKSSYKTMMTQTVALYPRN
jgi:hypothetical protein